MRHRRPSPILRADTSSKLRSVILDQFDPTIASQLIEFGKFLSTLDADVLVFMARKSLCLYDLLLAIGIPPSEKIVLSDRALDLSTDILKGKSVALIDDTLIVGTTIARTKDFLTGILGNNVTVHVFCVDSTWQRDDIIKADTVFLRADDRTVMSFCASLVRAMSLLPRPYLVDFPLTVPFRIRTGDMQCVLSATSWRGYRLSSPLQIENNVEVYTFLPQPETLTYYLRSLDVGIRQYIDIVKVRMFGRYHEDVLWNRIVPIITLLPLEEGVISNIVLRLLERLRCTGFDPSQLEAALPNPLAKQRFVQYLLSAALGKDFITHLQSSVGSNIELSFDETDIERHYGPWLLNSILQCISKSGILLATNVDNHLAARREIASVPQRVRVLAKEVLESAAPSATITGTSDLKRNIVIDCSTLFVQMYHVREIPARKEALRLGKAVVHASSDDAPFRDRLNVGLPWSFVVKHLRSVSRVNKRFLNSIMTSLALDICNDLGIVVPITCAIDGVIFRAYRYGEDAPFGDSELRLAYESVNGFLSSTKRDSITHLSLEKLLVFLLRAGVATKFLRPFYGQSGTDGTARVGFALKGAVVLIARGPRDRSDRDIWLTQHLCERNVIASDTKGLYKLGIIPDSDGNTKLAITQAKQIGLMLGHCIRAADDIHEAAPLDVKSLILLMTCCTPHHTAAALEVELDLFRRWYEPSRHLLSDRINWHERESIEATLGSIRRSSGYEAIHSGLMKYDGHINGYIPGIIRRCSQYLSERGTDGVLKDVWDATWDAIGGMQVPAQELSFRELINEAAVLISEIGIVLTSYEIALQIALYKTLPNKRKAEIRKSVDKLRLFVHASHKLQGIPSYIHKLGKIVDMDIMKIVSIDSEQLAAPCLKHMDNCMSRIDFLVDRMEPVIEQYGRLQGKHIYKYFIYYDIIDSTATQTARRGGNTEQREQRVAGIKLSINKTMESMAINARKHRGEVYCTTGNIVSTNDCKHIFISGKMARKYVEECLYRLLYLTSSFPDIHLRMYAFPCDFVKSDAYCMHNAEEVSGTKFWSNWSRVLKEAKKYEDVVGYNSSFLLVGDDRFYNALNLTFADWLQPEDAVIEPELAESFRKVNVRYGAFCVPKASLQGGNNKL